MQDLSTPHSQCLHMCHPNGIYEFVLLQNTWQAVDDYIARVEPYFMAVERGELHNSVFCMMIELREMGMPPIADCMSLQLSTSLGNCRYGHLPNCVHEYVLFNTRRTFDARC